MTHRKAPVTARLRDQSDAPLVIETAPMAINGENGISQKKATLRTASSFAIRPGVAPETNVFMAHAPIFERQYSYGIAWPITFVKRLRLRQSWEGARHYINPRTYAAQMTP